LFKPEKRTRTVKKVEVKAKPGAKKVSPTVKAVGSTVKNESEQKVKKAKKKPINKPVNKLKTDLAKASSKKGAKTGVPKSVKTPEKRKPDQEQKTGRSQSKKSIGPDKGNQGNL
jgi:hypothetical protein